jgi:SAM-dependent methyltransferase
LLEIGPAAGFAMARASARGFRVAGVDVSAWARAQAHARTGAPVSASLDEVPLPAGGFQAVLMLQVLEHAPDAPALLRRVGCLLAPGGVLLLETWDVESRIARWSGRHWQQVSPPSVLWLFGRRSIVRLLEAAGFAVERIETPGKLVGSGRPLYQLLAKLGAAGRRLFRLLDRIGLTRLPMRYRRKDLITVLARRVPAPDPAR